jgi:DNA polymerase III gamma/tau subunit
MKGFLSLCLFFIVHVALAAMDPFDFHAADVVILQAKKVQQDIKLTEAQRAQMNKAADWHRGQLKAYEEELKAKKVDPRTLPNPNPRLLSMYTALKERVLTHLTPAQLRRLREISIQRAGIGALADEKVATRVGMSAAQLKQFRSIFTAAARQAAQVQQSALQAVAQKYKNVKPKDQADGQRLQKQAQAELRAAGQKVQPRLNAIETQTQAKLKAVLTAKQMAAYEALRGPRFVP